MVTGATGEVERGPLPHWESVAPRMGRVGGLDVIRGAGVIGVVLCHAKPEWLITFAPLPDWFFVLSGFLIVTLLLEEHRARGRIQLRQFYARRSLRLLPNLYAVLLFTAILVPFLNDERRRQAIKEIWAAAIYVYNWVFPFELTAEGVRPTGGVLYHIWTLSIEEQFYIVVGFTLMLALRKGWVRQYGIALLAVVVGAHLMRLGGHFGWRNVLFQRPESLALGVCVAIFNGELTEERTENWKRWLPWVGLGGLAVSLVSFFCGTIFAQKLGIWVPIQPGYLTAPGEHFAGTGDHFYWVNWGFTVCQWGMAAMVFTLVRCRGTLLSVILGSRTIEWIGGRLSYSIYIWHLPIQLALRETVLSGVSNVVLLPSLVVIPCLVGWAMYYLVERRALRLKDRFAVIASPKVRGVTP